MYPLSHRDLMFYWVPLYQFAVYSAALLLFRLSLRRFPRFAVYDLLTPGLFWDQIFMTAVPALSIIPCVHYLGPRAAAN